MGVGDLNGSIVGKSYLVFYGEQIHKSSSELCSAVPRWKLILDIYSAVGEEATLSAGASLHLSRDDLQLADPCWKSVPIWNSSVVEEVTRTSEGEVGFRIVADKVEVHIIPWTQMAFH